MNLFWPTVIKPLLEIAKPKSIVEIGCESGENTRNLLQFCNENDCILYVVDPLPKFDADEFQKQFGDHFVFIKSLSLNALPKINYYDAVLIDGDHNWYTVYHELKLIEKHCIKNKQEFPLVMLHDIGWPYGRRDLYYNPENIPEVYRKPYKKLGIIPGESELQETGGLNAHLYNSIYENDLQNGVLTAIEDFMETSSYNMMFYDLPGLHGLGILFSYNSKVCKQIAGFLETLKPSPELGKLFEVVENTRITNIIQAKQLSKENVSLRERVEETKQEYDSLRERVEETKQENVSLRERVEETKQENVSLRERVKDLRQEVQQNHKDIQKLTKWIRQLKIDFKKLLISKRWKIGNLIVSLLNLFMFKRMSPSAINHINEIFLRFDTWSKDIEKEKQMIKSPDLEEIEQLYLWIKELDKNFNKLFKTKRWKISCIIGWLSSPTRGWKRKPRPVLNIEEILAKLRHWESELWHDATDKQMLILWIMALQDNYQILIKSKRWKIANRIVSFVNMLLFRREVKMCTKNIQAIFAQVNQWQNNPSNSNQKARSNFDFSATVSPEEAAGEPYTLLPPYQ